MSLTSFGCLVMMSHSSSHIWCLLLPSRERKVSSFRISASFRAASPQHSYRAGWGWGGPRSSDKGRQPAGGWQTPAVVESNKHHPTQLSLAEVSDRGGPMQATRN